MIARSKGVCLLFVSLLIALCGRTQEFSHQSLLKDVPQSGFYRIPISLEWAGVLKQDLSDLRIVDDKGKQARFIIDNGPSRPGPAFLSFPVLTNRTDSSHTILELDARGTKGINGLNLVMSNSSAERYTSLSGSEDGKQWFIIKEAILLKNAPENAEGQFAQQIQFPFIRYPYLRLKINNRNFDPLNILKAGILVDTAKKEEIEFFNVPVSLNQTDSTKNGSSYIRIQNNRLYPIDRIRMVVEGERYFKRGVDVYSLREGQKAILLSSTEFVSGKEPVIELGGYKAAQLLVIISNGDNPPLKVSSVKMESERKYLISYLQKGIRYQLLGGSSSATPPQYDLAYFKDSIPPNLSSIEPGKPTPYKNGLAKAEGNSKWWLWPLIIGMLVILAMLTFKMAREVKSEV